MIPRLPPGRHDILPPAGFFERLIEAGFKGDIETGEASRTVFSTDNSIYQVEPLGIVFPCGIDDLTVLATVLSEPAFSAIRIAPRGGGTGTNGQSLTSGLVVDCSRHMNRILEIDPVRRIARVEAGVVKDQLNRALEPYGLFFAPELSTSNRATIGGMVSTDACGQGSCLYGKTSNHVLGLHIVLADGTTWWSRGLDAAEMEAVKARRDRVGEIHRTVERIVIDKRNEIADTFPKLNRYMTGYDLAHVIGADGRFHLNSVLCGSEGTLAVIAEAEINLLPIPEHSALINIRYEDFNAALENARSLVALNVASLETIDETVLSLAKDDITWTSIERFFPDDGSGAANGINIVEVVADSLDELSSKIHLVAGMLERGESVGRRGYTMATDKLEIDAIWSMRKRAVGLLGNVDGRARPVPFVEDTVVPPVNLAAYIREFRALLDKEGLSYGMFGHVDAGVLHVRPALDLTTHDHQALVRKISDAVVGLTRKHGGVLWGEHGKGVRSEYVPDFFGPLYPCLQEIKRAFDPNNRLNPGKIAVPDDGRLLKIDEVQMRGQLDSVVAPGIAAAFDNAAFCNGNGACFDFDQTSPMCPSFKATGDRRFSPKGRASLLREWLRRLAEQGIDPRKEAKRQRHSNVISGWIRRAANSLNPRNRDDFSHEVRAAMDTCLGCKACAGQCPVRVDVPAFRSKFLELYYGRYLRPLRHQFVAPIETLLPIVARVAPFYNLMVTTQVGKALLKTIGLVALPRLPSPNVAIWNRRVEFTTATPDSIKHLSPAERARIVVFVPDAFTLYFDPDAVRAAVVLAERMGLVPMLSSVASNGKALHVHGHLGRFATAASKMTAYLNELGDIGVPLVGIDPSMTLTFRSEYLGMSGLSLKAKVLLPQEWLSQNLDRLKAAPGSSKGKAFWLFTHCSERTNAPTATKHWIDVFQWLGIDLRLVSAGCCGMAGTFGHEAANRQTSEKLYSMSWKAIINRTSETDIIMASGYSCRSQVKEIETIKLPHPLEVVSTLVGQLR